MPEQVFTVGQVYKRSFIHDQFGGNRQGGISPSAKYPFIFIFSLKSGHQHGYKDQWENNDIFSYSGEGQVGDMDFIRGNLALKDHLINKRRVFLFIEDRRSFVSFQAELEVIDYDYFDGIDKNNNPRIGIKFFFKRAGVDVSYSKPVDLVISEPVEEYLIKRIPTVTERMGLVTSRVGQGAYRKSLLYRWEFKCAVTKYNKADILIASHIVPWKDSSNEERLDVDNGILLSPNYDALFDQHLISFENSGRIILSDSLTKSNYTQLGVDGKETIMNLSAGNFTYLEKHRLNFSTIF
jgi:hypothetical protein